MLSSSLNGLLVRVFFNGTIRSSSWAAFLLPLALGGACVYRTSVDGGVTPVTQASTVLCTVPRASNTFSKFSYILIEILVMVPTLLILGPSSLAHPQMSSCISQPSQVVSCNIGKDPGDWQCPFLYCSWYNFIMAQPIEQRYSNQTHCNSNYMIYVASSAGQKSVSELQAMTFSR